MSQAVLRLDPQRPYAGIAVVRVDLSELQVHIVPAYLEPSNAASVQNAIPNMGILLKEDLSRLVAAFNGGFKAVNVHYGLFAVAPGRVKSAPYRRCAAGGPTRWLWLFDHRGGDLTQVGL